MKKGERREGSLGKGESARYQGLNVEGQGDLGASGREEKSNSDLKSVARTG